MERTRTGAVGPAVLELGRDVGAVVIYTSAALEHAEIEIRPSGGEWDGTHTAVHKRPGRPPVYAALFFGLPEGGYDIRVRTASAFQTVKVTGGRVVEAIMT